MHKPKPYRCSVCGQEVTNLPMPVLKHQLSHAKRRPFAESKPPPERHDQPEPSNNAHPSDD